jgi:putative two-component system response regulator
MIHEGTILVVEDTLASLKLITDILVAEGYQVRPADSGDLALASVEAMPPELILLDIIMPGMDGFEVLRRLKAQDKTCDIPVIILSSITETAQRVEGLNLGAVDFISKPYQPNELLARVRTHMELFRLRVRLERNLKGSIDVISEMIEKKGACTPGHHRRVAALASAIAREVKLTDFQMQGIGFAAAVYDIGLIDIPSEFIQDTTRLEGLKLTMYQGYPKAGHDALMKIESPWPITEIILQHRECFDGSGFPRGLKGEAILIEARILAVVDTIEDLTSNKINRPAMPIAEALAVIGNHSGTKYDPDVVAACLRLFKEKGYKLEG